MTRFSINRYLSLLLCVALNLIARPAFAQQGTTAIVGDVTDPQGATVNGAKVTLADPSSAVSRETTTDEQGHFQFLSLQPGTYTVHVEASGFKSAQTGKIEALVSSTQKLSIKLELGTVSDTVTVTEGAVAPVNTTDATLGKCI